MRIRKNLFVELDYLPVVCDQSVDLALHIGGLRIYTAGTAEICKFSQFIHQPKITLLHGGYRVVLAAVSPVAHLRIPQMPLHGKAKPAELADK